MLPALKPLFGDIGFPIDAPTPSRWYLRVPRESETTRIHRSRNALGDDLFEHLTEGADGRRWRALLSEAQVVLHNHPWNAQRIAQGKLPVNALWFWGGGVLPDAVQTSHGTFYSDEETLRSLAYASQSSIAPPSFPQRREPSDFDVLNAKSLGSPFAGMTSTPLHVESTSVRLSSALTHAFFAKPDTRFLMGAERDLTRFARWLQPALLAMQRRNFIRCTRLRRRHVFASNLPALALLARAVALPES